MTDKPELVRRKHFKDGEFIIDGLDSVKYQFQISSPQFVGTRIVVDFQSQPRHTDYGIVILHPFRNEAPLLPGMTHSISVKMLQQKIPNAAQDAYRKAVDMHRQGNLDNALIEYGRALRSYPLYVNALTDIGTIFLLYNRPDSAMTFLRRAEDVDDCNVIVKFNIAVALTEQEDYGASLKLLKNLLHSEPRLTPAQLLIARINYIQKKYDQAEVYVRQALENDPRLLDAWVLMININLERKDYDQARQGLQRIRETMSNRLVTKFIDEQLSALGS
jgi:tetratricopeptide (TPR) repeat protein